MADPAQHAYGTRPARQGGIDLRATMRASRTTGLEPVVCWPAPAPDSGGAGWCWQPYARIYLHLMRAAALRQAGIRPEVFDFSTTLTRLTAVMAHRSPEVALARANARVSDRYGGTHLGRSIAGLLAAPHGNALRGAVVIIASDGWDSDPPRGARPCAGAAQTPCCASGLAQPPSRRAGGSAAGRLDASTPCHGFRRLSSERRTESAAFPLDNNHDLEVMQTRERGAVVTDATKDHRHDGRPRILLLYYSYTGQALKVLEAAGEVFCGRGCEVHKAEITFTDERFAQRFSRFPMRHVWLDMLSVLPAQVRRASGAIRTPDEVRSGDYDLICIGSSTWWGTTNLPMRSFLKSDEAGQLLADKSFAVFVVCRRLWRNNFKTVRKLGTKQGGRYSGGVHFGYPGGQLRSLLSLTSYLASGEYRDRYLGVRIPPTNVQPDQLVETRKFATALAHGLLENEVGT